jgi:hypothetical protein
LIIVVASGIIVVRKMPAELLGVKGYKISNFLSFKKYMQREIKQKWKNVKNWRI